MHEAVGRFDGPDSSIFSQLNGNAPGRIRHFPNLRSFIAAIRRKVQPLTVTRPAGNDVICARNRGKDVRGTTRHLRQIDFAVIGRAIVKSDETPIVGPAGSARLSVEKSELGGIGAVAVHGPDFVVSRLAGLK